MVEGRCREIYDNADSQHQMLSRDINFRLIYHREIYEEASEFAATQPSGFGQVLYFGDGHYKFAEVSRCKLYRTIENILSKL